MLFCSVVKIIVFFGLDVRLVISVFDGYINKLIMLKEFVEFFGIFDIDVIDVGLNFLIISFCLFRIFKYKYLV